MVKLIRMMLTVIGAALLNKMLKGSLWPSANSEHSGNQQNHLKALQNTILALLLSRSRGSWIMQSAAISTVGTLFAVFMSSMNRDHESKDQIIEINEYKIVDEFENRAPEGYKVVIDDCR